MSHRQQLIQVQRRIYGAIRRDIDQTIGRQPRDLARYQREYKQALDRPFRASAKETLLKACERADILFVGDYHTLAAAQEFPLRLLRLLWERGHHHWVLALEMLQVWDASAVARYVAGEADEEAFLREIEYERSWGFDWDSFRPFFETARELGIPVIGINCDLEMRRASLTDRDGCAAWAVAQAVREHPHAKILVVDGDMHVAPTHLPARVEAHLREDDLRRRWVAIHQNVDSVHWRLVEQERERAVQIVRFSPREFAVQHTHPIVKSQSYLNWLEYEAELSPVLGGAWGRGDGGHPDHHDQVQRFVDTIAKALGIRETLDDFTIHTVGDLDYLDRLEKVEVYTLSEIELVFIQILKGESHFLPDGHMIYLANLTVNHAAEEAAHYVNFKLSGPPPRVRSREHDFYHRTMREVLGFFGSKIINPQRLAYREEDFREMERELRGRRLSDVKQRDLRKIVRAALHHIDREQAVLAGSARPPRRLPNRYFAEHSVLLGTAHALGYRLGLWLYNGLEQGAVTRDEVRDLFTLPFEKARSAQESYFDLLTRLRGVKVPYEKRRERF